MINTVLFDCSGSMAALVSGGDRLSHREPEVTRTDVGFKVLDNLFKNKYIHEGTPIVAFDHKVRGGVTYNLLNDTPRGGPQSMDILYMNDEYIYDLFFPDGGTDIDRAINFAPEGDILIITDDNPRYVESRLDLSGRKNVIVAIIDEREPSGMYYL